MIEVTFKAENMNLLVDKVHSFMGRYYGENAVAPKPPAQLELPLVTPEPSDFATQVEKVEKKRGGPKSAAHIKEEIRDHAEEIAAPKVSKDDVKKALQELCEKDGGNLTKVQALLKKFGVSKVGELDEKVYHEVVAAAQAQ